MRTRRVLALALLLALAGGRPAAAWDPNVVERESEPTDPSAASAEPVPSPNEPPTRDEPPVPEGIYYVTDVYTGEVVTRDGPRTTYETATVHESPGTYARPIDTVGSGDASRFDGASFNGRASLSDGRAVAGTYYETFIKSADGYTSVSIVFFQDDSELARQSGGTDSPGAPAQVGGPEKPAPAGPPPATPPTAPAAPPAEPRERPDAPGHRRPLDPPAPGRGAVTLRPVGSPLDRIEVLRGRTISLWLHAYRDGREIPVRAWSLVSGDPGDAVALNGGGAQPFVTSWDGLSPPGEERVLRFVLIPGDISPATPLAPIDAVVRVTVRSPALAA